MQRQGQKEIKARYRVKGGSYAPVRMKANWLITGTGLNAARNYGRLKMAIKGQDNFLIQYHIKNNQVSTNKLKELHGMSRTKLYRVYASMKSRCSNINDKNYFNYGGRGISIYPLWDQHYLSFYLYVTENGYKEGLTIERINNDGNYEPGNIKFIPQNQQQKNTRANIIIDGVCLMVYCKERNLPYSTIRNRIKYYGWPLEKALHFPIKQYNY